MGASIRLVSADLNNGMAVFGAALGSIFWDETLGWLTVAGTLLVLISAMPVGRGMPQTSAATVSAS